MTLAIFDLDKTITKRDTFIPFLVYSAHKKRRYFYPFIKCFFWGTLFLLGIKLRKDTKEKFLQIFLNDIEDLSALSNDFADFFLKNHLILDAVKNIENHRALGHRLLLASASPSLYVCEFAKFLDIEFVVSANCEVIRSGGKNKFILHDDLIGINKLIKIKQYFDLSDEDVWAYSDSENDLCLLQEADFSFAINPTRSFRKIIKKNKYLKIMNWK